jgi:hypothetical protein
MSKRQSAKQPAPRSRAADEEEQARRRREEWERDRAESLRLRDEVRRRLFDAFDIWTICDHKVCRRNKGCRGDTEECVMKRWRRVVPAELRSYIGKAARLVAEGMTAEEAVAVAEADLERHRKLNPPPAGGS